MRLLGCVSIGKDVRVEGEERGAEEGVLTRLSTRATTAEAGRSPSRAYANASRDADIAQPWAQKNPQITIGVTNTPFKFIVNHRAKPSRGGSDDRT